MSVQTIKRNFKLLVDAILLGQEFKEGTVIKTNGHIPFQTTVFEFTDDKPDFVIELQNQDIPKINEVVREKSKKEIAKEEAEKAKADAEKAKADEAAKAEAEKAKAEAEKAKAEATKTDADPKESK